MILVYFGKTESNDQESVWIVAVEFRTNSVWVQIRIFTAYGKIVD
jgi:hypothetical protein